MNSVWKIIYNGFVYPLLFLLFHCAALFNQKIRFAIIERYKQMKNLDLIADYYGRRTILIHASSMGEFEHVKPIIGKIKATFPNSRIFVSFFSPSGFNNVKNFDAVNRFFYIPFDFPFTMKRFYDRIKPDALIIAKYDLWPNMIWQAFKHETYIFVINASLTENSLRHKGILRYFNQELYRYITQIWVSHFGDVERFKKISQEDKIRVTGDTKFDQVLWRKSNAERFKIIDDKIIAGKKVFIAGSIWPEDVTVLIPALEKLHQEIPELISFLVPHETTSEHIQDIEERLHTRHIRFSKIQLYMDQKIIIVNRVGVLAALYAKANFAYVGGSFKQNVHNVLEPAVYGIPVMYGPVHNNSFEAVELNVKGGSIVIESSEDFYREAKLLLNNEAYYHQLAITASKYVEAKAGASDKVIDTLKEYLS